MKRILLVIGLLVTLVVILALAVPAAAASDVLRAPGIPVKESTSSNWAGYAVETDMTNPQTYAVTDVKGQWTVPAVSRSSGSTYSSIWVGIDGNCNNTVEQIGTEQDWIRGRATYYAWFEMYPHLGYRILAPVSPGDKMVAEVKYIVNGQFVLTLTDSTAKRPWTFTTTQRLKGALCQSAEWVIEAPSSLSGQILPLANFGTVTFTAASATLNTHTGSISDTTWVYDQIDMVSSGATKASTSSLSDSGGSFSVTWYHN